MNKPLVWYRRLIWVGILINLCFAIPALFFPDLLGTMLGSPTLIFAYVWLANAGMLLVQASLSYLPAAYEPEVYHVYAWLGVFCRLGAAAFWFWQARKWELSGPMGSFYVTDGTIGVLSGILLQWGLPARYKLGADNLLRWLRGVAQAAASTFDREPPKRRRSLPSL